MSSSVVLNCEQEEEEEEEVNDDSINESFSSFQSKQLVNHYANFDM